MSEYHIIEVKFKDEGVLLTTLRDMGYEPEIHSEAKHLRGFQGDKRSQKANIILPRVQVGRASNDVGFERVDGGFVLHASQFDSAWRDGAKIKALKMGYAENKLKKTVSVMSNCSIFSRKQNEKGQIEIQLRVM
jgi:hypothetical protein